MILRALALLALAGAVVACASARRDHLGERGFLFREQRVGGRLYRYAVYVPRAYDPARAWPLVLFLHGRGESGLDGVKPIVQGIGTAVLWNSERWPAVVLFPQKPTEDSEWEQHETAVLAILDRTCGELRIDDDRVYLTGISQGGHGTWVLGARHRDRWAALVAVCAYAAAHPRAVKLGLPPAYLGPVADLARGIGDLPVWLFHGDADDTVPVAQTRRMAEELAGLGHPPQVTIYPGVDHNSWDRAYAEEGLSGWLLAQRRPRSRPQ